MKPPVKISSRSFIRPALLLLPALGIFLFSYFPAYIEQWYSNGIYPGMAAALRILTMAIPFSAGDILYIWLITWLIISSVRMIARLMKNGFSWAGCRLFFLRLLTGFLWVYITFKLLWGLNYNRLGIAYQLRLSKNGYTKEDVIQFTNQVIDSLNVLRRQMPDTVLPQPPVDAIYAIAYHGYQEVSINYPFLNYTNRSVKSSLFTPLADYAGFTGYYNPFTGEAQLRTDIPRVLVPFVACHEMAHQLGYASESEANFVGYLAATASGNHYFRYSVYLDLFSYAQREEMALFAMAKDSTGFNQVMADNRNRLDTLVKKDRKEIREFFYKRSNRVSPLATSLFDQYLKFNNQEAGMNSYDEVIGWLIDYRKKLGKL